jgi:AAA family ATP:ADP antiporter
MLLSSAILATTIFCVRYLIAWRGKAGAGGVAGSLAARENPERAMGGNPFAGVSLVAKSPYLLGISAFVILLATSTTFLYFDQARMIAQAFPKRTQQTQVFSLIDFIVQALAITVQLFFTGRIASRLGAVGLLVSVPILMVGGFVGLSIAPVFSVLAVVMVIRRSGEYALARPAREMLFTTVDVETKYKAKNFIDTVVYRGGDAVSGWAKTGLDSLGQGFSFVALIGAALAALWAWVGFRLGQKHDATLKAEPASVAAVDG